MIMVDKESAIVNHWWILLLYWLKCTSEF